MTKWNEVLGISVAVTLLAIGPRAIAQNQRLSIAITVVPPADPNGGPVRLAHISGTTANAPADARVVIFARTDVWYVQPFLDKPFTAVVGGRWENDTHLGAEYAALLVAPSYKPPAKTGALPPVGADILALVQAPGRK